MSTGRRLAFPYYTGPSGPRQRRKDPMLALTLKTHERMVIRVPGLPRPVVVIFAEGDRGKARLLVDAVRAIEINREVIDRAKHPEDYGVLPLGGGLAR